MTSFTLYYEFHTLNTTNNPENKHKVGFEVNGIFSTLTFLRFTYARNQIKVYCKYNDT